MTESTPMQRLLDTLPQIGRVEWIGVRPSRGEAMIALEQVEVDLDTGLVGDRFGGRAGSPRQVTLIQQEHLGVIAALLHREAIDPSLLRRNIIVPGINRLALKNKSFSDRRRHPGLHWALPSVQQNGATTGARRLQCHARPRRYHGSRSGFRVGLSGR